MQRADGAQQGTSILKPADVSIAVHSSRIEATETAHAQDTQAVWDCRCDAKLVFDSNQLQFTRCDSSTLSTRTLT